MIARIIIVMVAVAGVVMTVSAGDRDAPPVSATVQALQSTGPHLSPLTMPAPTVVQSGTCAADCQTHHDRCRVRTKGSPTCDAERQACLEKCLQKKAR